MESVVLQVYDQLPGLDARHGLVEAGPWLWALGASGAVALDARTLLTVFRWAAPNPVQAAAFRDGMLCWASDKHLEVPRSCLLGVLIAF